MIKCKIDAGVGLVTGVTASVMPAAAFGVNIALNAAANARVFIPISKRIKRQKKKTEQKFFKNSKRGCRGIFWSS